MTADPHWNAYLLVKEAFEAHQTEIDRLRADNKALRAALTRYDIAIPVGEIPDLPPMNVAPPPLRE